MKNLMILIKSFFLLRPRFLSTIFFIPILYGIGWGLSQPLLLFNFEEENLSLIGTIITFFLFIFLLPYWFYIKRKKSSAWRNQTEAAGAWGSLKRQEQDGGGGDGEKRKNGAFLVCGGTIGHRPLRGRCPKREREREREREGERERER